MWNDMCYEYVSKDSQATFTFEVQVLSIDDVFQYTFIYIYVRWNYIHNFRSKCISNKNIVENSKRRIIHHLLENFSEINKWLLPEVIAAWKAWNDLSEHLRESVKNEHEMQTFYKKNVDGYSC